MTKKEGQLVKWTNFMHGWQLRWFRLEGSTLSYYSSDESSHLRDSLNLRPSTTISLNEADDCQFSIENLSESYYLRAINASDRERWIQSLEEAKATYIEKTRKKIELDNFAPATISKLKRKLQETQACKAMLVQHVDSLIQYLEKTDADISAISSALLIRDTSDVMMSNIKQCVNVIVKYNRSNGGSPLGNRQSRSRSLVPNNKRQSLSLDGSENSNLNNMSSQTLNPNPNPNLEDSFYDAHDEDLVDELDNNVRIEMGTNSINLPTEKEPMASAITEQAGGGLQDVSTALKMKVKSMSRNHFTESEVDTWLHDESSEPDQDDAASEEKSVILSLLSQLKIGMDLTKVTLPAFILERRSLLEMYADFMSHPDIFSAITDYPTPQTRMKGVLLWYLTAFHEGRKSSVAKKPYNPILGETFRCTWDLATCVNADSNELRLQQEKGKIKKRVVSTRSQCSFIAEQVSHHPPVSAFYVENKNKNMCMNAHLYTKSKFLGISVGVINIGTAHLCLLDHNEVYEITWPAAYARSILGIPWVELCGPTSIVCKQTGYRVDVEFLAKPNFGGSPHHIRASMLNPSGHTTHKVTGRWNDVIYIQNLLEEDGKTTHEKQVFADVSQLKVIKKRCAPIEQQQEYESRVLWRNVTRGLKTNDLSLVTNEKHKLEKRQRDEASDRLKTNKEYHTTLFYRKNLTDSITATTSVGVENETKGNTSTLQPKFSDGNERSFVSCGGLDPEVAKRSYAYDCTWTYVNSLTQVDSL